jgi:hypothetical protein
VRGGIGRRGWIGLTLLAVHVGGGCITPHVYRYRPPTSVDPAILETCHARADHVAQERYERYADMIELTGPFGAPFGGPFGGITLAQRAYDEREEFYEREMKTCLNERGQPM